VFGSEEIDGQPVIAMELVSQRVREGRTTSDGIIRIWNLAQAHEQLQHAGLDWASGKPNSNLWNPIKTL